MRHESHIAGWTFVVIAATMAWVYFKTYPSEEIREPIRSFYERLDGGWWTLRNEELARQLNAGQLDEGSRLLIRSAFVRWRLRARSPLPFETIMRDYQDGDIGVPDADVWREKFEAFDRAWIAARRRQRAIIEPVEVAFAPRPGDSLLVEFVQTRAARLGSLVTFEFEAPIGAAPQVGESIRLLWRTNKAPLFEGTRRKLAVVEALPSPNPERAKFALRVDFSSEPEYLAPDTQLAQLFFTHPTTDGWRLMNLTPGDSPNLRP